MGDFQRHRLEFVEDHDKWVWNLEGDGVFKVSTARRFIDEGLCDMDGMPTRWLKLIPIKVNVLAWRLASNKLLTRFNMLVRGLEIQSMVCPVCHVGVESSDHLFFSCPVASSIMAKVLRWWGIPDIGISSYQDRVIWFEDIPSKASLFDVIVFHSFIWCNVRARRNLDWLGWLKSHVTALL
ncbi:RNA-directed DNA polymerase, eukaryota [Tanacetum coccineum]